MPKKKSDPKATPGFVPVRLMLTPAERDRLRVVAAEAGKPMAIWCQEGVRKLLREKWDGKAK